jgi:histidine phosphotransfer protein HptB
VPDAAGAVLEIQRICTLAAELDSPAVAIRFLGDFLDMLPGRVSRILRSLQDQDREGTLDAVLSLKITSSMAGALDTEQQCRVIEANIRSGNPGAAAEMGQDLAASVNALLLAREDLLADARLAVGAGKLEPTLSLLRNGS